LQTGSTARARGIAMNSFGRTRKGIWDSPFLPDMLQIHTRDQGMPGLRFQEYWQVVTAFMVKLPSG